MPSSTLLDIARRAARQQPERGFRFVRGGQIADSLSYGQLDVEARAMATSLAEAGVRPGERALLVYEPGLEMVRAFWGCVYAGVVAVPAAPPHPSRLQRTLPRLVRIAQDCEPSLLLAGDEVDVPGVRRLGPQARARGDFDGPGARRLGHAGDGQPWSAPEIRPHDLALLQYTSGSTRDPRGVRLTHANLAHNLSMLAEFHRHQSSMVMVHWLPLFHDMGLIRGMLSPVHMGGDCVMLDAMEFVQRPRVWLEALSRFGATVTGAPDFGYALAARKVDSEALRGLDFSRLEVAFCSAEPIRAQTLRRFEELLHPHGLRETALKPAYGLAEATVMVSGEMGARYRSRQVGRLALGEGRVDEPAGSSDALEVVSCGQPLGGQELLVVDDAGCPLGDQRVGEIWLRGPSVSQGYWKGERPDGMTADGRGPFLRTGDLGWLDSGGSLSVCGRLKDVMIVRGQNFHAHDVEAALEEAVSELRPGCGAAFEVEDGVAVAYETRLEEGLESLASAVWAAAGESFGLSLREVALLAPGTLPKTASGKVQRSLIRQLNAAGQLPARHRWVGPPRP